MPRLLLSLALILGLAGVIIWLTTNQHSEQPSVSFATVQQNVQQGAKLYDVRTAEEYASGHFANAELWPLTNLEAGTFPNVSKDTQIYVYCRSGNRSSQATSLLEKAGYTKMTDLGGLADVEKIGGVQQR